jgi:hypothetical protein
VSDVPFKTGFPDKMAAASKRPRSGQQRRGLAGLGPAESFTQAQSIPAPLLTNSSERDTKSG